MVITKNRVAAKIAKEIAISHSGDVENLSKEDLRIYIIKYIEDWGTDNRDRFVDEIYLELVAILDTMKKLSELGEFMF